MQKLVGWLMYLKNKQKYDPFKNKQKLRKQNTVFRFTFIIYKKCFQFILKFSY